jgi:hypothetical protein
LVFFPDASWCFFLPGATLARRGRACVACPRARRDTKVCRIVRFEFHDSKYGDAALRHFFPL